MSSKLLDLGEATDLTGATFYVVQDATDKQAPASLINDIVDTAVGPVETSLSSLSSTVSGHTSDISDLNSDLTAGLAGKQPLDSDLTAIAALTTTSFGRGLLESASADALRAAVRGDILGGFRNKLINGDFDVWQRGTTVVSGSFTRIFGPDRWALNSSGTGTPSFTQSRQDHTPGQTAVPGNPRHFARFAASTSGAFTALNLSTRIEDARTHAGKTVTVTLYAKVGAPVNIPAIELFQSFGTGGSPSSGVSTSVAGSVSYGTSFTKYQYEVALPSVSGKTFGSNNDSYLALIISLPTAGVTFDLSRVSVVEGAAAGETDPFSPRHIQQELALCQRYFEASTSNAWDIVGVVATAAGQNVFHTVPFKVPKRAIPTIALGTGSSANVSALSTGSLSTEGFYYEATSLAAGLAFTRSNWTADAEL